VRDAVGRRRKRLQARSAQAQARRGCSWMP
jgi:hypothetical protein